MKTINLLIMFLIVGCGAANVPQTAEAVKWAQSDYDTTLAGCISSANGGSYTVAQVDTYCHCIVDAAESKWTASDFASNTADDSAELITDGTAHTCTQKAIQ